jgi:uncharacterized protein YhbP (UPF0306 family)
LEQAKQANHAGDGKAASTALRAKVLSYLQAHQVMTLATAGPWAAAVFYVNDGFTLYFLSSPKSRHAQELAAHPRVAITIQEDYGDWRSIKGIQMEGVAALVPAAQRERVIGRYGAKFPLIGDASAAPAAITQALARIEWYQVTPRSVYFVDNSVAFGHRDRVDC